MWNTLALITLPALGTESGENLQGHVPLGSSSHYLRQREMYDFDSEELIFFIKVQSASFSGVFLGDWMWFLGERSS